MKPQEIYNLWVIFDKATTDPAFSIEQRIAIGQDLLAALPPEMLCSASKPSLSVVTEAMEGRLNEYTRSTRTSPVRPRTSPLARPEGDEGTGDEGSGVSVADLADAKEPTVKKAGRKPKELRKD